jgi:hypothetical protein
MTGKEPDYWTKARFVHFTHFGLNLPFRCPLGDRAFHLHLKEARSFEKRARRFLDRSEAFDVIAISNTYSRLDRAGRRSLLTEIRKKARPDACLAIWDDLQGVSPIDLGVKELREAAANPAAWLQPELLTPEALAVELEEAGWRLEGKVRDVSLAEAGEGGFWAAVARPAGVSRRKGRAAFREALS